MQNMQEQQKYHNTYLAMYNSMCEDRSNLLFSRNMLTKRYSWAIPTQRAIEELTKHSPLVEIGAGSGYWAQLVEQAGGDIIAYDKDPYEETWTEIKVEDDEIIDKHSERTLFMSWPPQRTMMSHRTLKNYDGETFVYIGEQRGGCTGVPEFFDLLERDWEIINTVELPQWEIAHDNMAVYKRL